MSFRSPRVFDDYRFDEHLVTIQRALSLVIVTFSHRFGCSSRSFWTRILFDPLRTILKAYKLISAFLTLRPFAF